MPAHPDTPEPLKSAINDMEAKVQRCKNSLAFAAPEIQDEHWITLQQGLVSTLVSFQKDVQSVR